MTSYTVFSPTTGYVEGRWLTAEDAAVILLTADSYAWELRPWEDGQGWTVWISPFSAASPLGGRPLERSRFVSAEADRGAAWAAIVEEIIRETWHGYLAVPDDEYERIAAAEEDAAE